MEFFKHHGEVVGISEHSITIKVSDAAFREMKANLKVLDKVDIVISRPQIEDLQEYVREFNKVFSR